MLVRVQPEIDRLKKVVESLLITKKRPWLFGREDGELDELKFVDALAGAARVYKKRSSESKEATGGKPTKIHLRFLVDCSASMFRFNFADHRLTRQLEMLIVIMEALHHSNSEMVTYDIFGHSGDSAMIKVSRLLTPVDMLCITRIFRLFLV